MTRVDRPAVQLLNLLIRPGMRGHSCGSKWRSRKGRSSCACCICAFHGSDASESSFWFAVDPEEFFIIKTGRFHAVACSPGDIF